MLKPEFVRRTIEATERLVDATADGGPALLFGTLHPRMARSTMRWCWPRAARSSGARSSTSCPITAPSTRSAFSRLARCRARSNGAGSNSASRSARTSGSSRCAPRSPRPGPTCCSSPTAAPTSSTRTTFASELVRARVIETGLPLAYVNRVGGQDEIVFDGSSFVVNDDGEIVVQMPDWDEALLVTDWARGANGWRCETREPRRARSLPAGHLSRDDGRPCAIMSATTAFPA